MDIKDIRQAKNILQKELFDLIQKFERDSEVSVTNVRLSRLNSYSMGHTPTTHDSFLLSVDVETSI